jgi:hypothetical protein
MKNSNLAGLCLWALCSAAMPVIAADTDPNQCLECHEPAEDWAGLTLEEIVVEAKAPGNKRHKDNEALSDEQLKLIILSLMPESAD